LRDQITRPFLSIRIVECSFEILKIVVREKAFHVLELLIRQQTETALRPFSEIRDYVPTVFRDGRISVDSREKSAARFANCNQLIETVADIRRRIEEPRRHLVFVQT